jgi:hypothetical protein
MLFKTLPEGVKFSFDPLHWSSFGGSSIPTARHGILSRALPILALGFKPNQELKSWLKLTHVHEDGHASPSSPLA